MISDEQQALLLQASMQHAEAAPEGMLPCVVMAAQALQLHTLGKTRSGSCCCTCKDA